MTENKKFPIPSAEQEDIEEALGVVWHKFVEEKQHAKSALLPALEEVVGGEVFSKLLERGLVRETGKDVALTPEGESLAKDITRRHRLAERLLSDVLSLDQQAVDPNACQLEHIISEEVTESICTLLGHPKQCPHGSLIPPGACCERLDRAAEPIVVPMDRLKAGEEGKIAYVLLHNHPELHKLLALGVVPGTRIRLHQTFPAYVLEIGESQLALEEGIAKNIFIRKA